MSLAARTSYPSGPSSAFVQAYMCWSPELEIFVAVSGTNTNNIMYSSNGTTWEYITKFADNTVLRCVSWSPQLGIFVIIVINREFVYISKDGKNWDQVTIIKLLNNQLTTEFIPQVVDMCWCAELGIFLAVGNNSKIMTSKNGRNWNLINVGITTSITRVCWSKELGLFVAVCRTGSLVSISNNGTQWTHINIGTTYSLWTVTWAPGLGLFVAGSNNNIILTSPDGIKWSVNNSSGDFLSSCWSPELGIHVVVGNNTIVTSSLKGRPPTSYNVFDSSFNSIDESGNWTFLSSTITSANINNLTSISIDITNNINPLTNNTGNLGSATRYWGNAYIRDLSASSITISQNLDPLNDTSGSLGGPRKIWSNAYINDLSIGSIDVSVNCNPLINANGSLGIPSRRWDNAYMRDLSVGSIDVSINLNPLINSTGSLGTFNKYWGNAYICDLSLGSIDVSVNCNPLIPNNGSLGSFNKYWRDAYIRDLSTTNISVSGNIILNICGGTITNINKLTAPASEYKITTRPRLYQEISGNISSNVFNCYYGLAKEAYPGLNPLSSGVKALSGWFRRTVTNDAVGAALNSIVWSSKRGMFVCGGMNGLVYSSNGINWTFHNPAYSTSTWVSVTWSNELNIFVAVSNVGGNNIIRSSNGASWPDPITVDNNFLSSICWSSERMLFVVVCSGGSNRVRTSKNAITWNSIDVPLSSWSSVCWSPELMIFVAVASTGNQAMYSSDGSNNWITTTVEISSWTCVCWSPELGLFAALASNGTFRAMTSYNGKNWNPINIPQNTSCSSICWVSQVGLFIGTGSTGSTSIIIYSSDGILWTTRVSGSPVSLNGIAWCPEFGILALVGGQRMVRTSSLIGRTPISYSVFDSPYNSIDETGRWTFLNTKTTTGFICDLSSLNIDISTNLTPLTDNNGNLGGPRKLWGNAYIRDLSVSSIDVSVNCNPLIPNNGSLGTFTKYWPNAYIRDLSATNISISGNIILNICGGTITNINKLTPPVSDSKITTTTRLYQEISGDISWSSVNGYYGLAKEAYPVLNPLSSGVKATNGLTRTGAANSWWVCCCWSPELRLFVAGAENNANVMISNDGINWSLRAAAGFQGICWSPELKIFVGVASGSVRTSSTGQSWSLPKTGIEASNWYGVCWSPQLGIFVAVALNGINRTMTSRDGTTWIAKPVAGSNVWYRVCWSPEVRIFVACGSNCVMSSSDGITWRVQSFSGNWQGLCWSSQLGLFVVASRGTDNNILTSLDGITWNAKTARNSATMYSQSLIWSPELGIFISTTSGTEIQISTDAINWTRKTVSTVNTDCRSICWSPELGIFVAPTLTSALVITSSLKGCPPTSYNVFDSSFNKIDESGKWTFANIDINTNLNPLTNNNGNLGGPLKLWGNAYIRDLSVSSIDVSVNLIPLIPNNGSIGLDGRRWGNIHTVALNVNGVSVNSDDRIKHNEIIITNGLTIIDQLTPKFYQKTLEMLDAHYYGNLTGYTWSYESGLIAQELLQINDLSFVVSGGDYYDSNNILIQNQYSVNYNSVFVYGLAGIKELDVKIKNQESIINSLLTRIEALENKL
jgi:hypothetical protein